MINRATRRHRHVWVAVVVAVIACCAMAPAAGAVPAGIPPDASFTITPSAPYQAGQSLTFSANTTTDPNGGTLTYAWTVDGTAGSTNPSFSQTFTAGSHTISLAVTDSEGDPTQTTSQTITVDTLPSAAFTITPSPPYQAGQNLTFSANTTTDPNGGTLTYAWTVDGVSASTSSSFSQTLGEGPHTIALQVTDSEGDPSQTSSQTVSVTDQATTASFTAVPAAATAGTAITFTGTRSGDPDDTAISYAWRFGDGATASGAAATASHAYTLPGTYTVVLTITDEDGQTITTHQVTVSPAPFAPAAPTAAFTAPRGREGTAVAFDGSSSRDPNAGGALGYRWDFGDGSQAAGAHATHRFATGTWTVTLTVTDDASGLSNSASHRVTISDEPPTAAFTPPKPSARLPAHFKGSGSDLDGTIRSYRWTFGDGAHASGRSPAHAYAKPGRYRVTLKVTDSSGQASTVVHIVTVARAHACVVPNLKGLTPAAARRALSAAHCSSGPVSTPTRPTANPGAGKSWRLAVAGQAPAPGAVRLQGSAVSLTLAWHAA